MLGCPLCLTVTAVGDPLASALPAVADDVEGRPVAVLRVRIDGGGRGWALILLPISALYPVLQRLLGTPGEPHDLTEIDRSAVLEFGNVLASSFLSELGDRLGRRVLPSPPELHLDDVRPPVRDVLAWARALDSEVGVVQARLEVSGRGIEGQVFVVLDVGALLMTPGATGAQGVCR
jgi:chemotaxis protein CheC